jgi:transcriptional regulator with XRE-family HTH domain
MPRKPTGDPETRLDAYLREWGAMSSVIARRSGISNSHLLRLRRGESEPSRRTMVALADTISMMRDRTVYIVELFELSRADEAIYVALLERKASHARPED